VLHTDDAPGRSTDRGRQGTNTQTGPENNDHRAGSIQTAYLLQCGTLKILQLHTFALSVPDEHWLPEIRRTHPDYAENIGRLAAVVERKYPRSGVIDIGANIGDTAAIIRSYCSAPILCIEGSEPYIGILKQNLGQLGPDVEVDHTFVGSADAVESGAITVERGTAFFRPDPRSATMVRFERMSAVLARHPRFCKAKLLKIDADGMDGSILIGALDWLATAQPVIFWEHDIGLDREVGGPALSVFDSLLNIGYRQAMVFDNEGEYILTLPLEARQQLADLSDYLPGGTQFYGYCDICSCHETDLDLWESFREMELESRRLCRKLKTDPKRQ
jgi:FkbM family methyltransferase